MKEFLYKNKVTVAIVAIIVISLFFRTYHLIDWLHFQLDQSRDSFLIRDVFQKGIADLPLLGPRAGGSFLRLGPAYYYMMYLAVIIARNVHPVVFALPEIVGSIAFVPVFYLLARRLFDQKWSLMLALLAVTSTFLITYDRFSWNPNLLPLFSALTIYLWLRFFEAKREENYQSSLKLIAWLGLVVGIFTQLHFVGFVALPIVLGLSAVVFWLRSQIYEPTLAKKYLKNLIKEMPVFLLVFILVQTPIILNEYLSKGTNTKQLFSTVTEKQNNDTKHNTAEKLIENLWVYPKGYFITTTGQMGVDYPEWLLKPNLNIVCDYKCRDSLKNTTASATIFLLSAITFIITLWRSTRKVIQKNKKVSSKIVGGWEFLALLTIWIVVPWWSFYSLSFALRPRFFLFSVVPFWIITGIFLKEVYRHRQIGRVLAYIAAGLILISNLFGTYGRFDIARSASVEDRGSYPKDQILFQDEYYPVTLRQEQAIAEWIKEKAGQDSPENHIFIWAPSFYYRPILYLLSNLENEKKIYYFSHNPMWTKGSYFAITRDTTPNDFFKNGKEENFNVAEQKTFGTLSVYRLSLSDKGLETAKSGERKFLQGKKFSSEASTEARCTKKPNASCRYTWSDVFSPKN